MEHLQAWTRRLELQKHNALRLWVIGSLLAMSLLFLIFQGGRLAYMLFFIMFALSFYLIAGRWSGIARVKGKREMLMRGDLSGFVAGSSIPIQLSAHVPGFWPLPYIVVKEEIYAERGDQYSFEVTFVPDYKRHGKVTYQTPPLRRGLYHFRPTLCLTEDIFGVFRHYGVLQMEQSFHVLPLTVPIKHWNMLAHLVRGAHHHAVSSKALRETTQINGVREYVYGDRISRIHWNATARTGTWKSKEFERETLPRTIIALDQTSSAYKDVAQFELAVSVAASIFQYGVGHELPLGLLSAGKQTVHIEASKGSLHFAKVMQHLVTVEADSKNKLEEAFVKQLDHFQAGSFIIIISPRNSNELVELVRLLKYRQLNFCHIWIKSETDGEAIEPMNNYRLQEYVSYPVSQLHELSAVLGGRNS